MLILNRKFQFIVIILNFSIDKSIKKFRAIIINNGIVMEQIKDALKLREVIKKEAGTIVYFYNDDCAPCLSLRPKVESLVENHFPKMHLVWINSKVSPAIPAEYGIFANPTILIFFEGKEFKRYSKYVSIDEMHVSLERYYNLLFG